MSDSRLFMTVNFVLCGLLLFFTFFAAVPAAGRNGVFHGRLKEDPSGGIINAAAVKEEGPSAKGGGIASETEALTMPESEAAEKETSAETQTELTDLALMREEYLSAFAGKTPAGIVTEEFFDTKGATDTVGKVSIKNTTASRKPDFAALIASGAPDGLITEDISQPTVLIFHTHTTESYLPVYDGAFYEGYETRSTDPARNMIRVGNEICSELEKNGIGVIHDTNIYDESYNGAYARSRVTVLETLKKYPSIRVVLDVHRDAVYYSEKNHCKPTAVINGEKAAQIMIITGAEDGQVTDFPGWENNLRFALAVQKTAQEKYEGLMKPIFFCPRKYNMDTADCSLLLEFGTDANTLEEACRSARMMGDVLSCLIKQAAGQ